MRLTKKYLIIGVLAVSAALAGSACGKKGDNNQNQNRETAEASESNEDSSSVQKDDNPKTEMDYPRYPEYVSYAGFIDLEANAPELDNFEGITDFVLSDLAAGSEPRCFFDVSVIGESDAESMGTEFTAKLEEVPEKMKMVRSLWEQYFSNSYIYYMAPEQDFEIIADKSEKVIYDEVDFIREEGRIEIRYNGPKKKYHPEPVTIRYIAFYYTYSSFSDGMGMALWGTAIGFEGENEEEGMQNYDLIKKSADKSMATFQAEK